jgi:hypothetical protein
MGTQIQSERLWAVFANHLGLFKDGKPLAQERWAEGYRTRWAVYQRLSAQRNCAFVTGSPCELEMIDACIKGKKNRPTVHLLDQEWQEQRLSKIETFIKGQRRQTWQFVDDTGKPSGDVEENWCESLDGTRFRVMHDNYDSPRYLRRVKHWLRCQHLIMRGFCEPWVETAKEALIPKGEKAKYQRDRAWKSPELSPLEFVVRYFFAGMHCQNYLPKVRGQNQVLQDRLIKNIYFNRERRMILVRFESAEEARALELAAPPLP